MSKKIKLPSISETVPAKIEFKKQFKDIPNIESEISSIHKPFINDYKGEEMVRTSVFVSKKMFKKLKVYCATREISLKDFITASIEEKYNLETKNIDY